MTFMFVVTMTALLQSVYKIFLAWQNGTFTFLVQGLQLIVAVALIVLALLVVIHCVAKLRDPETKSEPEAAA
jgi:carbon starvation protein